MIRRQCYRNVFNIKWRKVVVAARFIRALKNKMTAVSRNVYFDFLDDIVDKYKKTSYNYQC